MLSTKLHIYGTSMPERREAFQADCHFRGFNKRHTAILWEQYGRTEAFKQVMQGRKLDSTGEVGEMLDTRISELVQASILKRA